MFKKVRQFFKSYQQFGLVIISLVAALVLQLIGQETAAHWILALSAIANAIPLVWGMVQDLRVGTYGVDILAATAIISSVLFGEYWTAMIIVFMLTGGEALEDYAENRAQAELSALLERAPIKAHVLRKGKEIDVPVNEVNVGDKLLIKPGEVIPVDVVVLEGTSDIDESSLTGESLPVMRSVGQDILSGALNTNGSLTVKALRTADDSQYSQIIKLVKAAQKSKAPFVRLADLYAVPFTFLSFTIALGAWALSGDSMRFLQVLVVATPCPLILGAPIALVSGMSRSAKRGIIVKNGGALEQLARVKTLALDKTGTLTKGIPEVKKLVTFGSFKKDEVLSLAAAVEQKSNHVLANTIVSYAMQQKVKLAKAKHVSEKAGLGLSASFSGRQVLVGRFSYMQQEDVELPKSFSEKAIADTAAYIAINGKLAGVITFEDQLRPETKSTIARLKALGIRQFSMVTGDNQATANRIAKQLNIDTVIANALPADKLMSLETAVHKPVGFVGDGVNDAPVLTAADVGIALGARGSTAASESADVVIMTDNFEQVAVGIEIAKRTLRIAKQAIFIGIAMSVVLMLIFATGKFPPIYGAIVQEFVDVVVILYALRAHLDGNSAKRFSLPRLKRA